MPSFEIPDGPTSVPLKPVTEDGKTLQTGDAAFGVTNKAAAGLSGRLSIQVAGDAKSEWFSIEGEPERPFAPGETQTVNVRARIPGDARPGDYKFRLRIVAVNDPDNDHMASPVATVQIAARTDTTTTTGTFPWWIFGVAAGVLVLIAAGVAIYFAVQPKGPRMPDLAGQTVAEASLALQELDLDLVVVNEVALPPEDNDEPPEEDVLAPGTVVSTEPARRKGLEKGQEVILYVASGPQVAVRDVTNRSLDVATALLADAGFTVNRIEGQPTGAAIDWVLGQTPANGTAAQGSAISLTVDPGVPYPDFVGDTVQSAVNQAAGKVVPTLTTYCENGIENRIVAQAPAYQSGLRVRQGLPVTLSVRRNPTAAGVCSRYRDVLISQQLSLQARELSRRPVVVGP